MRERYRKPEEETVEEFDENLKEDFINHLDDHFFSSKSEEKDSAAVKKAIDEFASDPFISGNEKNNFARNAWNAYQLI